MSVSSNRKPFPGAHAIRRAAGELAASHPELAIVLNRTALLFEKYERQLGISDAPVIVAFPRFVPSRPDGGNVA